MADTPVPFSSHLEELRKRLIWVLIGVFVAFTLVFVWWAEAIVRYIQEIAVIERVVDGETVRQQIKFAVIGPLETFGSTMRVSLYAALVFAYPWTMVQIYAFVAPGLYRHERRFFQVAIPSIFVLFFAGAAFGRYVLLPISIGFLLDFNVEAFDVAPSYSLGQFLNLVFTLTFGLGFVFQVPLLIAPVIRFGLLTPAFFRRYRKWTLFISIVLGAVISPTGLVFDMLIAGAPIFLLVEFGVVVGSWWRRSALRRAEAEALELAKEGKAIDPEAIAGGLAGDLEKKLRDFAGGGARQFARELIQGLREGKAAAGETSSELFDDDYSDADKPPAEVKLKPRPKPEPKPEPTPEPRPQPKPDQMFTPARETAMDVEAAPAPGTNAEAYPDRPWVEGVDENLARYIEDRVAQRMRAFMDTELRPWMERVEHELREQQRKQE